MDFKRPASPVGGRAPSRNEGAQLLNPAGRDSGSALRRDFDERSHPATPLPAGAKRFSGLVVFVAFIGGIVVTTAVGAVVLAFVVAEC
jgi:hypothetical protein